LTGEDTGFLDHLAAVIVGQNFSVRYITNRFSTSSNSLSRTSDPLVAVLAAARHAMISWSGTAIKNAVRIPPEFQTLT